MSHPTLSRRKLLKSAGALGLAGLASPAAFFNREAAASLVPQEPLDIGHEPQFVFDLHVVDCTWALEEKREPVQRVFHPCRKHDTNPVLAGDDPSHLWVVRDKPDGLFRLYYQLNQRIDFGRPRKKGEMAFLRFMGYAESTDGVHWTRPNLDLFKNQGGEKLPRNTVLFRPDSPRTLMGDTPQIVQVPERDSRGYRYHLLYLGTGPDGGFRGIRMIGSKDGVHWDAASDTRLAAISSDHHNTVVYDPKRDEYVMYLRSKHIYLAPGQKGATDAIELGPGGERLNTGQSRRGVSRMASKELWTEWASRPQQIITPDEADAASGYNFFYGMPVNYAHGIYWGFLQSFRMNDYMHAELAWSRDGIHFERLPQRPKLIDYGPDGSWDDTLILACPNWIEVGDEWWIYYNGWDGPHETVERYGGVGLAKVRKEGFVSQRGPAGGGVVCTRELRWPGGDLLINADARQGELRVRVSDAFRRPIQGYNYTDCATFKGDSVSHEVKWKDRSLDALKGQVVRLEFHLTSADLYTFRAAEATA